MTCVPIIHLTTRKCGAPFSVPITSVHSNPFLVFTKYWLVIKRSSWAYCSTDGGKSEGTLGVTLSERWNLRVSTRKRTGRQHEAMARHVELKLRRDASSLGLEKCSSTILRRSSKGRGI